MKNFSETMQEIDEAKKVLNDAGYDCGTPDGKAGDKTHAALNAYQEANGLTVQNDITDEVLTALGI
jgi:peptidoglycan hydrolase-like protein with peptidoglycan-binding domain